MIYGPTLDPWCQRLHLRTWWKVPLPSQCLSFFSLPSLPSILQISSSRHLPGQTGHTPRFELWSAAIIYEDWRRIAPVHKWWWQDTPAPQCPSLSSPKMSSQAGFPSSYKQIHTKTKQKILHFCPIPVAWNCTALSTWPSVCMPAHIGAVGFFRFFLRFFFRFFCAPQIFSQIFTEIFAQR